ncbi:MAG: hypothetical protein ACKVP7_04260 [Hyphomicrobiaceae bacterium]
MNPILRSYAHTAWTPLDPLQGLDVQQKRAILLMPSTFRERLRLAPWTNRDQRRVAVGEILAERRLMYDLMAKEAERGQPSPVSAVSVPTMAADGAVGPYYQYRLGLHRQALSAMQTVRHDQDHVDRAHNPEAERDYLRRAELRQRLLKIEQERARLDIREARVLAGDDDRDEAPLVVAPATRRSRRRARER